MSFDRYITIQKPTNTNTKGDNVESLSTLCSTWAERKDAGGRESIEDGKTVSIEQSTWRMQYVPNLKPNCVFYEGEDSGIVYTIKAVNEITRKGIIEVKAEQRF